jgi:hypothetical protein
MEYTIPKDIQDACKRDKPKDEKELESVKTQLKKFLEAYLSLEDGKDKGRNSLANITDIVSKDGEFPIKWTNYPFERDMAGRMMRTRNFTMQEGINEVGKKEVYVIAADRDWWDRNKLWFTILTTSIGIALGVMADPLKGLLRTESDTQYLIRDTIQVRLQTITPTFRQVDTVYNLPIVKKDSSK